MKDLKGSAIRGGLARLCALCTSLVVRVVSLLVLARILSPSDFGIVGMVMAFTGVLVTFRDFGLSSAAVQRDKVTEQQISTLFWINLTIGALLGLAGAAVAPAVADFYGRPELLLVTMCLAFAFFINSAGVQHSALLQRQMRFTALSLIDVFSLIFGNVVAIAAAEAGYGYWSLVALAVATPLAATSGYWFVSAWVPGLPSCRAGIRPMMHFGSILTLNGLVAYVAYNAEKIMLGRAWGPQAIGVYGRAHQLLNLPTDSLNTAIGEVAFSALSRVQNDPVRLKSYFLKGFALVLGLTLPITIMSALFADDLVLVLLGPQWKASVEIVRLLAPTVAIRAIINPLGWLLYSLGLVGRSLRIALVFAPVMIIGYYIGLPYGPDGIAIAYSITMGLWVIPHIFWCVFRTPISAGEIWHTVIRTLGPGILGGALAYGVHTLCGDAYPPLLRLVLESATLFIGYFGALWFSAGQRSLYIGLFRGMRTASVAAGR